MLSAYGIKELEPLWSYINDIDKIVNKSQKKVIIWGLGKSGKFLMQMLKEKTSVVVDMYIDEKVYIYGRELKIRRSSVLNYINNNDYIILSTVKNFKSVMEIAYSYGYELNTTIFDVYKKIGESYLDILCNKYHELDFSDLLSRDNMNYNGENMEHKAVSFPNIDKIFEKINQLQDSNSPLKFIDLGCGKGAALVMAKLFGIKDVSGLELLEELHSQAIENVNILGLDCKIMLGNVLDFDFDDYNFFYFYNPFRGKVFVETIRNIEESFYRVPRDIYIYYGNPFEHATVVANGLFKLIEQFEVDFYDPIANLYVARCDK